MGTIDRLDSPILAGWSAWILGPELVESCVELLASKNVGVGESQNTGTLDCWDSVLFIYSWLHWILTAARDFFSWGSVSCWGAWALGALSPVVAACPYGIFPDLGSPSARVLLESWKPVILESGSLNLLGDGLRTVECWNAVLKYWNSRIPRSKKNQNAKILESGDVGILESWKAVAVLESWDASMLQSKKTEKL